MLLSTQKTWAVCKQLFCILCLCSKHQITEIEYQSISFHELWGKIMLMGARHPTKLNVKQSKCDKLTISIHRFQWQVSGFVLSCRWTWPTKQSIPYPVTGSAASGKRAPSLSLPCLYRRAICTTEHLTHEDFHVFLLINLSSDIFEAILSIISLCQNSL